jgi:hypothetical protein
VPLRLRVGSLHCRGLRSAIADETSVIDDHVKLYLPQYFPNL